MASSKPRRKLPWWVRWMHTYVSLIGFGALIFFAVTGLTLNHAEWFEGIEATVEREGTAPKELLAADAGIDAGMRLMTWLRDQEHLHGHARAPESDEYEVCVSFEGAGYVADVIIDRETCKYSVLETRRGFVAIMNDLHKGRHTSAAWGVLIDLSAIVLALSGATGIWLLWFLKKIRFKGLAIATAGTLVLWLVYLGWQ